MTAMPDLVFPDQDRLLDYLPPECAAALRELQATAVRRHRLSGAERELVLLGINAAVAMYDPEGVGLHARRALEAGASPREVMAVIALVGGHGSHTYAGPANDLLRELQAADVLGPTDEAELESTKQWLTSTRGLKTLGWDGFIQLDPELFAAYTTYMARSVELLAPRTAELVIIASDVVATSLIHATTHIRRSIALGIAAEDLIEVYSLAMMAAWKGTFMGARVVAELGLITPADLVGDDTESASAQEVR